MIRTLTIVTLLTIPIVTCAQGKLDAVRDAVDKPRSSDDKSSSDSWGDDSGDGSSELFLYALAAPWVGPYSVFDPGLKFDGRFTHYPFATSDTGYVLIDRWNQPEGGQHFSERHDTNWYSVRASGEVGSDFDGLTRVGLRLFLDTDSRFGLKTDWDYYSEKLECGCRDEFWIGDVTGTYRFVQNEWLIMHTGVGARFLLDHGHDRAGVNFLYGFDAFPSQPVHLFGSFEGGTLGNAGVLRLHGGAGVNYTHFELFAGYDYLNIGGAILQGPFVGLRLWF
jgi:hypothetical protein